MASGLPTSECCCNEQFSGDTTYGSRIQPEEVWLGGLRGFAITLWSTENEGFFTRDGESTDPRWWLKHKHIKATQMVRYLVEMMIWPTKFGILSKQSFGRNTKTGECLFGHIYLRNTHIWLLGFRHRIGLWFRFWNYSPSATCRRSTIYQSHILAKSRSWDRHVGYPFDSHRDFSGPFHSLYRW
jgi:hypothetical protein